MIEKYMIGASWCEKCRALKKTAEDLGFIYIDTDEDCTNAVERYNVKALPTFIITDGGVPIKILEQPSTNEELLQFCNSLFV